MNVLLILGTNRQRNTYQLAHWFKEELEKLIEITWDEIQLPRDFNSFCTGCEQCFFKGEIFCSHYEQLKPITEKIEQADLIILATPVYAGEMSGSLKTFLDHYSYQWLPHRPHPRMFQKVGVVMCTSAGARRSHTLKTLKNNLLFWGIKRTYGISRAGFGVSLTELSFKKQQKLRQRLNHLAKQSIKSVEHRSLSFKTRLLFYVMRIMHLKGFDIQHDHHYWEEQGWLGKNRPWH